MGQGNVCSPGGMVVTPLEERIQGIFAGMASRAMTTVVTKSDGFSESNIQPEGTGHTGGDLGDFEGVGETGSLVVVREDEDLGLAGKPAEG